MMNPEDLPFEQMCEGVTIGEGNVYVNANEVPLPGPDAVEKMVTAAGPAMRMWLGNLTETVPKIPFDW